MHVLKIVFCRGKFRVIGIFIVRACYNYGDSFIKLNYLNLLILVFIPGIGLKILGARRWINLGFFVLQPSEFVKLALTIYLAAWFSIKEKGRFLAFLLLIGLVILLVMLQPDMGTAVIILGVALVMYFRFLFLV